MRTCGLYGVLYLSGVAIIQYYQIMLYYVNKYYQLSYLSKEFMIGFIKTIFYPIDKATIWFRFIVYFLPEVTCSLHGHRLVIRIAVTISMWPLLLIQDVSLPWNIVSLPWNILFHPDSRCFMTMKHIETVCFVTIKHTVSPWFILI